MSDFDALELTTSVHSVLRTAATLSFGSMVFPYNPSVVWPERRAARAAPLRQWMLERETFEEEVVRQYGQLGTTEVRELVAGTGVGKTTKMPYLIAKHHHVNGLVLFPNHYLPLHAARFLVSEFMRLGGEVSVAQLRTAHQDIPHQTPCVYLSSAATFLGRLAARPTLLRDLGIDFIYLDESHEKVPDYIFFKYAVSSKMIEGCKVFFGTATASADVAMESGGIGRTVQSVPPDVMSVASPAAATSRSPLHYSRIVNRTVVHLANDHEINSWFDYYNTHDVPVYKCTMSGGTKPTGDIRAFLDQYTLCVLLVHHMFRTGVTENVDTSICGGYTSRVVTDFGQGTVTVQRVPVTQSLRVQTMGRVGRFKPGTGYFANVDVSPELTGMEVDNAFYVYLWAQVFSLKINDPDVSGFAEVTGDISPLACAILLHARLPPVLLLPYVGNNGFRQGWAKVADYVLYVKLGSVFVDESTVNTDDWATYTTGPVKYAKKPVEYKSMIRFPREWAVIPAYAWSLFQGDSTGIRGMRAFSVISATPTEIGRKARDSVLSVDTVTSHTLAKNRPVRRPVTPLQRDSIVSGLAGQENVFGVPKYTQVRDAMTVRDSMPNINTPPPIYGSSREVMKTVAVHEPELVRNSYVGSWVATVPTSPTTKSIHRVDSDMSDERNLIELRQVNPVKYKYHKLYPMDPKYFDTLVNTEGKSRVDRARLDRLLTGIRNLVSMGTDTATRHDDQGKYFLSVLRIHNHAVSLKAQLASNVRMTVVERAKVIINGNDRRADEDIMESARMLLAFQLESWFVGIDKRAPRASDSSDELVSPDYDYDESRARVMLAMGPAYVVSVLEALALRAVPYVQDGKIVSNAWLFEDRVITAGHAYSDSRAVHQLADAVIEEMEDDDCVVFHSTVKRSGRVEVRDPVGVENVYVLTYDKVQGKVIVLGDYTMVASTDIAYLHGTLEKGASGALVLSTFDGAILGMYVSYYGVADEASLSLVVPAQKFSKFLV